jgi:acid stress chaperone HdeB
MKGVIAAIVAATVLVATPAAAQKLDLSTVKCKEFIGSGKENIRLVLMWMTGYYADQDASPIVDFDKMRADAEKLGDYCNKNPDHGLITAAEEVFEQQ